MKWPLKTGSKAYNSKLNPLLMYLAYLNFIPSFCLVNNTEEVGPLLTVNITNPDTNKWHFRDLEPVSRYRFYLYYCTQMGCGPVTSEEYITIPEAREYQGIAGMRIRLLHVSQLTQQRSWSSDMDGWVTYFWSSIHARGCSFFPLVPPCFSYAHLCTSLLLNNITAVWKQEHSSLSRKTKCLLIWGKGESFRKEKEIKCHL